MDFRKKIILFLLCFLLFSGSWCFATELEISYPTLPTGETVNQAQGLPGFLYYVFKFGMFLGFAAAILSLILSGIYYFLSAAKPNLRASAKDRIYGSLLGLLLLVLTYLIITTINPDLRIFGATLPPPINLPQPPELQKTGVFLYKEAGCSGEPDMILTNSTQDLGDLNDRTRSIKIVQDSAAKISYVAILHGNLGYWGQCQQINETGCNSLDPFASSITVFAYNFGGPKGNITFYRKPNFDQSGGYLTIGVSRLYQGKLKNLRFNNVPEKERDCLEWDLNANCQKYDNKGPTLEAKNISSVKINGKYALVFIYWDPAKGDNTYKWTFCQIYPSPDDTNKEGPREIKWDTIQNQEWYPNWVVVFPVL